MTAVEQLGAFVANARWDELSPEAGEALKLRVLDSLGCAFGALDSELAATLRAHTEAIGGRPRCHLLGGGESAPDRAAFFNGALVRYLDFNDSFLAPGETCHPSDGFAPVLAAAEHAGASGRDLLTALAVSYQVQCRLSELAPVRRRGFDHTTQGAYAMAAGVSRALGLDAGRTAHAVAIAGTALNALRVTRTGALSNWKGLAAPFAAMGATYAALLAQRGVTGPLEVFEGNKGFMDAVAGRFSVNWRAEGLEAVRRTVLKRFDAEVHSQSAIEAVLELAEAHPFAAADVERAEVDVFDVAYRIIGGGEEGDKTQVATKEQADHSLPYLVAVALLDRQVLPEQFRAERILRPDVQALLRRVVVRTDAELSRRFPAEHPCRVRLVLRDGASFACEKRDYEGFTTRPMGWAAVTAKFDRLAAGAVSREVRRVVAEAVRNLDQLEVSDLCEVLGKALAPSLQPEDQPWPT